MGVMNNAWSASVKEQSGFKKINLKKEARMATEKQVGGEH